ncbi:protein-L-isoaspartate O-methyltransferase family protein [Frigidibacter sp. ROC022]|uniref:protein-L-isoaspartate O-methyltransferase family protein n=1 Tax=Frigidibacter sp. ROC022 TaxID=2971796 RepID=UPI00215ACE73|nr:protein-L-isoaspartate O-methyltransferase [Frigidibacter sp. ROC022]MCR8726661.1 protein-L-isoaspartate O-methyltransferase [Frigidibacter sp. ROC022]
MPSFSELRTIMVDTQVRTADVTKFPIIDAMLDVPREAFVPSNKRDVAYVGTNLPLSADRVVLDPRTLAKMLDALDIRPDELVLDVGCGLGYSSAVIGRMAEAVVALEEDEGMAAEAEAALTSVGADNVAVVTGPLAAGAAKHGPYDVITIQGGVEALPDALVAQLKEGGRIGCIFMRGGLGTVRIGHKSGDTLDWRYAFNAAAPVLPGFALIPSFAL